MLEGHAMNASMKSLGIDRLPVEERLILVEEISDSIAADSVAAAPLTDAQRIELQKRIEDDDSNPDDVMPWEQVKASTLARLKGARRL
jgi:putative addiction module component (TIGR02574 family)